MQTHGRRGGGAWAVPSKSLYIKGGGGGTHHETLKPSFGGNARCGAAPSSRLSVWYCCNLWIGNEGESNSTQLLIPTQSQKTQIQGSARGGDRRSMSQRLIKWSLHAQKQERAQGSLLSDVQWFFILEASITWGNYKLLTFSPPTQCLAPRVNSKYYI